MVEMVNVTYGRSNSTTNKLGQRPMQARAYAARAAQFLLLKAPPAAGKSRALMFVALDKMLHQGLEKTIVCVPETSIGGSFRSTDLTRYGFEANWDVEDRWNLCLTGEDADKQKVKAFQAFLKSDAKVHAVVMKRVGLRRAGIVQQGGTMTGRREEGGCFAANNFLVLLCLRVRVTGMHELHDLPSSDRVSRLRHMLQQGHVAEPDHELECPGINEVANQHAGRIAKFSVGCRHAAP